MKEILLIKQAVDGRTFINTGQHALQYEVAKTANEQWSFKIQTPLNHAIKELIKSQHELNVYLFREYEDQPTRKIWFYVKDDSAEYDSHNQQLCLTAQSCIEYVPDGFTFTI